MHKDLEKRCNETTKELLEGLKVVSQAKKEENEQEKKTLKNGLKYIFAFLVFFLIVVSFTETSANCDYLVKTKKGYRFNCGKTYYTKTQAKDINKRLFQSKLMPLVLPDRKVLIRFDHYKVLSITQKLNQEQLDKLAAKDW